MLGGDGPRGVGAQEGTALVRGAAATSHSTRLPQSTPTAATSAAHADLDAAQRELEALVRIPSISADPEHSADVDASADAVAELLRDARASRTCAAAGVDGGRSRT